MCSVTIVHVYTLHNIVFNTNIKKVIDRNKVSGFFFAEYISPFSTLVWVNEEANSQSLVKDLNIASVNKPIESRNKSPTALIYDRL